MEEGPRVIYQRMIQQADTLSGMDNKLLNQCKERFINCYKLNGGVANISVFVDKYINRIRILLLIDRISRFPTGFYFSFTVQRCFLSVCII